MMTADEPWCELRNPSTGAHPTLRRRSLLRVLAGAGMVGSGLIPANGSSAASPAISPVDSLRLQVLVDNATFGPFLPDDTRVGLKVVRHTGDAGTARMGPRALSAEFGLSILATSRRGGATARVLVDFGYSAQTLSNNLSLLRIDPATIDAAVLSHGHLDHYGGFRGLFGDDPRRTIPLYVGGEEVFCERLALIGDPPPLMGALDRDALRRAGFAVHIAPQAARIAGHAFTTGVIPMHSFERAAIPTQMRPGKSCDATALSPDKRLHAQLADDGEHELATYYNVSGLGLVVIASCSHRGVINSVRQAQRLSGIAKVHAVVGGFHLVRPRTDNEARRTVAELAAIGPNYLVPMHCTGEVFIQEALRLMPDKVIRPYVGTELIFAA